MSVAHYTPGDGIVVVSPHGLVVLGAAAPATLPARLWDALSTGRGLAGVLEALTGAYGTSLLDIPPFAIIVRDGDSVRIAVRGDLVVAVDAAEGADSVSGAGVTTWSERSFRDVRTVSLGDAGSSPVVPLRDGVVLASSVSLTWDQEGTDAEDPGAEPAEAPNPAIVEVPVAELVEASKHDPSTGSGTVARAEPGPAAPDVPPNPAIVEVPVAEPVEASKHDPSTGSGTVARAEPAPTWSPTGAVPPPVSPAPASVAPAVPSGLIDSRDVLSIAETLAPEATQRDAVPGDDENFEQLWGETVVVRPLEPLHEQVEDDLAGDHDGATISLAQARAIREARGDSVPAPLASPRPPAPGRIRLSTGQVLPLDRTVVVGRRPRSTRVTGTDLPHLVVVASPQQDISRSHVELRVEGDSIIATDLHTTNGTTLIRQGADPVRLHPGESTVVVTGDVLDLGDGISIEIEDPA